MELDKGESLAQTFRKTLADTANDISTQILVMGSAAALNPGIMLGGRLPALTFEGQLDDREESREKAYERLIFRVAMQNLQDFIQDQNERIALLDTRLAEQFSEYGDDWLEGAAREVLSAEDVLTEMPFRGDLSEKDYEFEINKALAIEMLELTPGTQDQYRIKDKYQDGRFADLAERAHAGFLRDRAEVHARFLKDTPQDQWDEAFDRLRADYSSPAQIMELKRELRHVEATPDLLRRADDFFAKPRTGLDPQTQLDSPDEVFSPASLGL